MRTSLPGTPTHSERPDAPSADAVAAHRRQRRTVAGAGLAVLTVAAIAVPVTVSAARPHLTASGPIRASMSRTAAATVRPGGRWTMLPKAPIAGRSDAVTAWTGTQMLIWGGQNGDTEYADGAAYDPGRRTWTTLPPSPLSARVAAASVWTGSQLYIWGGNGSGHADGARYDPSRRQWAKLPPAPVAAAASTQAVWTGTQVVLVLVPNRRGSDHLVVQAYNPSSNRWTLLPALRLPPKHDGLLADVVVGGSKLYAWSEWAHTVHRSAGETSTTFGIDGFAFDLVTGKWASTPYRWTYHAVTDPLWTGSQILIPAGQPWCGFCPGPLQLNRTGTRLDPPSAHQFVIPHGPADDLNPTYLWTGSVLIAADTGTSMSGGAHAIHPGVAAYWTPASNRWTLLPHAPLAGAGDAVVWTGHSLIVWGMLSPIRQGLPRSAGIELG